MKQLNVYFFGSFQVVLDGLPHTLTLKTEKARALFIYLLIENDRPHRREKLMDLFWPGSPDKAAHNSLRQSLYRIRNLAIKLHPTPFLLVTTSSDVQLIPQTGFGVDAFELACRLDRCEEHHGQETILCEPCLENLISAVDLYNGDFMDGFSLRNTSRFDWWLHNKREHYRLQILKALAWITNSLMSKRDFVQALSFARREVEIDPWCEPAHQRYMKALALLGERGKALRQYEICQRILATEVGIEPSMETRCLCERIRRDALQPEL